MTIKTFCTTVCVAAAALATGPASAFDNLPVPSPGTSGPAIVGDAYRSFLSSQQFTDTSLAGTDAFAGLAQQALPTADMGWMAQFSHAGAHVGQSVAGDVAMRLSGLQDSQLVAALPEPANLPLLGAIGVALLIAQLRRSNRAATV